MRQGAGGGRGMCVPGQGSTPPTCSSFQPMTQCSGSRQAVGGDGLFGSFGGAKGAAGRKRGEDMVKRRMESYQQKGPWGLGGAPPH